MDKEPPVTNDDDHPGVAVRPPVLYGSAVLVGAALEFWGARLPLLADDAWRWAGTVMITAGVGLALVCVLGFRRAGTNVEPWRPATALVLGGPYRFSRNPIYVGLTLTYAGIAVAADSLWMVTLLVPVLAVMQSGVVRREEAYLERTFGDDYRAYKARVRRWL